MSMWGIIPMSNASENDDDDDDDDDADQAIPQASASYYTKLLPE